MEGDSKPAVDLVSEEGHQVEDGSIHPVERMEEEEELRPPPEGNPTDQQVPVVTLDADHEGGRGRGTEEEHTGEEGGRGKEEHTRTGKEPTHEEKGEGGEEEDMMTGDSSWQTYVPFGYPYPPPPAGESTNSSVVPAGAVPPSPPPQASPPLGKSQVPTSGSGEEGGGDTGGFVVANTPTSPPPSSASVVEYGQQEEELSPAPSTDEQKADEEEAADDSGSDMGAAVCASAAVHEEEGEGTVADAYDPITHLTESLLQEEGKLLERMQQALPVSPSLPSTSSLPVPPAAAAVPPSLPSITSMAEGKTSERRIIASEDSRKQHPQQHHQRKKKKVPVHAGDGLSPSGATTPSARLPPRSELQRKKLSGFTGSLPPSVASADLEDFAGLETSVLMACDLCNANCGADAPTVDLVYRHPMEKAYYCRQCAEDYHIFRKTTINATSDLFEFHHKHCFLCDVDCGNPSALAAHCKTKKHSRRVAEKHNAANRVLRDEQRKFAPILDLPHLVKHWPTTEIQPLPSLSLGERMKAYEVAVRREAARASHPSLLGGSNTEEAELEEAEGEEAEGGRAGSHHQQHQKEKGNVPVGEEQQPLSPAVLETPPLARPTASTNPNTTVGVSTSTSTEPNGGAKVSIANGVLQCSVSMVPQSHGGGLTINIQPLELAPPSSAAAPTAVPPKHTSSSGGGSPQKIMNNSAVNLPRGVSTTSTAKASAKQKEVLSVDKRQFMPGPLPVLSNPLDYVRVISLDTMTSRDYEDLEHDLLGLEGGGSMSLSPDGSSSTSSRDEFGYNPKVFGFDTETAPKPFYPEIHHLCQAPHLIQIATPHRIWLFSTVPESVASRLYANKPLCFASGVAFTDDGTPQPTALAGGGGGATKSRSKPKTLKELKASKWSPGDILQNAHHAKEAGITRAKATADAEAQAKAASDASSLGLDLEQLFDGGGEKKNETDQSPKGQLGEEALQEREDLQANELEQQDTATASSASESSPAVGDYRKQMESKLAAERDLNSSGASSLNASGTGGNERVLPVVVEQFFKRQDITLVGFGTTQDRGLVRRLFPYQSPTTTNSSSGEYPGADHFHPIALDEANKQFAPTLDLAHLFRSVAEPLAPVNTPVFGANTGAASGKMAGAPLVNTALSPQHLLPSAMVEGRTVGAVQCAARVFQRRFIKEKPVSVSNWALGVNRLTAAQRLYAAKDALLPLFVYRELERLLEQHHHHQNGDSRGGVGSSGRK